MLLLVFFLSLQQQSLILLNFHLLDSYQIVELLEYFTL